MSILTSPLISENFFLITQLQPRVVDPNAGTRARLAGYWDTRAPCAVSSVCITNSNGTPSDSFQLNCK
jgi:hypothetical protein